eukprot:3797922-Prymnesium_polylepis.1
MARPVHADDAPAFRACRSGFQAQQAEARRAAGSRRGAKSLQSIRRRVRCGQHKAAPRQPHAMGAAARVHG